MEITKGTNKILIKDDGQFNIDHILNCGQVFRYKKIDNEYHIISLDKKAVVIQNGNNIEIKTKDVKYFYNYFDLDTDYNKIKKELIKKGIDKKAIEYGSGIRILKQDKYEIIISFIISQNNNIKRIQNIVETMSEKAGKQIDDYYAFPTNEALKTRKKDFFNKIGCGYRSDYLVETIKQLSHFDYKENLSTQELREYLLKLKGVGPKVADCILLFGYNRLDSFPCDTWIEKIYHEYFETGLKNPKCISDYLVSRFKDLSGYAQQYLFYYKRSNK